MALLRILQEQIGSGIDEQRRALANRADQFGLRPRGADAAPRRDTIFQVDPNDPKRRKPDITLAKELLGWEPKIKLSEGLPKTIEYFRNLLASKK